jgi:uncharacterized protein YgiM (DUF1202 family)
MTTLWRFQPWLLAAAFAAVAGAAQAEPGDLLRVTAERANLRSGPSDANTIRSQVVLGDELIELTRDGNWRGVRVLRTGEEGWIFSDLVERVAASTLSGGVVLGESGFQMLSPEFDRLMGRIGQQFGYRLVDTLQQAGSGELQVVPSREFLLYGGREAHIAATLAIYQMWKNHQNNAPVAVTLLGDAGQPYVTIQDQPSGPDLLVTTVIVASR